MKGGWVRWVASGHKLCSLYAPKSERILLGPFETNQDRIPPPRRFPWSRLVQPTIKSNEGHVHYYLISGTNHLGTRSLFHLQQEGVPTHPNATIPHYHVTRIYSLVSLGYHSHPFYLKSHSFIIHLKPGE